ncbi:MAG: aldehyde dehydrogenase family protein [Bifidobacterium crudilactis]|nr:aldehyde dehydrogenase family protein [Bifidobacterium crudilactis]
MAYATINPYTEERVASFPTASDEDVRGAIAKADQAFTSWKDTSFEQRAGILARVAEILRERHTEFAKILTLEMGKLLTEAEAEVELSAQIIDYYVEHAEQQLQPRTLPSADYD